MKNQRGDFASVITIIIGVLVVAFIILGIYSSYHFAHNYHTVGFTVNKTDVVYGAKGSHKYLIYTTNGVYEDTDSFWNGKFNSSDLYNQLESGKSYSCNAVGFRNGFLSSYENLLTCEDR